MGIISPLASKNTGIKSARIRGFGSAVLKNDYFSSDFDTEQFNNSIELLEEKSWKKNETFKEVLPDLSNGLNTCKEMNEKINLLEKLDKNGKKGYSKQSELILHEMLNMYKNSDSESMEKSGVLIYEAFVLCLKSFVGDSSIHSGSNAERIFREMEEFCSKFEMSRKPDLQIYTLVIDAYANSSSRNAGMRAESLLNEMFESDENIVPSKGTLKSVMKAWVRSGAPEAAIKVDLILTTMEQLFLDGIHNLKPDEESFSLLAIAYLKDKNLSKTLIATSLEGLLERMQKFSITSNKNFHRVVEAYANVGDLKSTTKAEQILNDMLSNNEIKVDTRTFNTVILGWAKTGVDGAGERAERIYRSMKKDETNVFSVNLVLLAYVNEGTFQSIENAEAFLRCVEQCKLDEISYNTVLNGYAQCSSMKAALRAEELLNEMEKLSVSMQGPEPETMSYNSVINAWVRSGYDEAPQKARSILFRMGKKWNNTKKNSCKPCQISFNMVMRAYGNTPSKDSGREAEKILR